jgi:hypothetical protein
MLKSFVVLIGLIAAVTMASQEAAATKRCAPLPVQGAGGPTCKCTVQNYGTVADTGVNIVVYDSAGGLHSCNALTIPARTATYCHVSIAAFGTCGCVVSGEGSSTYASLSVTDGTTAVVPQLSVPCQ